MVNEDIIDYKIEFKRNVKIILVQDFAGLSPGEFWQDGWVTDFRGFSGGEIVSFSEAENNISAKIEVDGK